MIDYQVTLLKSNLNQPELAKSPTKIGALTHHGAAEAFAEVYDMDGEYDIAYGEKITVSVSANGITKEFELRGKMTAHYAAFEVEQLEKS